MSKPVANTARSLRTAKGWTQQTLAEKAGLAYRTVSIVENGGQVKRKTLEQIADALGVTFEELIDDSPQEAAS